MSVLWIHPPTAPLGASVALPYSKSLSNRQLVLGAQTGAPFRVEGLSDAEDTRWLVQALQQIGYTIGRRGEVWEFWPPKTYPKQVELFLGEGGTTLRFLLPWLARLPVESVVQVAPPLQRRPLLPLIEALRSAGAHIQTSPTLSPLRIRGEPEWRPSRLQIDSSLSSQFLSGLFLLAPHLPEGACIQELSAKPATSAYSEATRQLLQQYGWAWQATSEGWTLRYGSKKSLCFVGERDWSAASFFFGWAALTPAHFQLPLHPTALQPEYQLFSALPWPYHYTLQAGSIEVVHADSPLPPLALDMRDFPDATLVLAVVSAFAEGPAQLTGIETLPYKESHRLQALQTELSKIGVQLSWDAGSLQIEPISYVPEGGVVFDSHGDHRVAMALSLVAAKSKSPIGIADPFCVRKSFPGYWEVLAGLGIKCTFAS